MGSCHSSQSNSSVPPRPDLQQTKPSLDQSPSPLPSPHLSSPTKDIKTMTDTMHRSSREHSAIALKCTQQATDLELKSREQKAYLQTLRAQLEAAEKEDAENERIAEELRTQARMSEEASKKSLFAEQRHDRQEQFPDSISDHVFTALKDTISTHESIKSALESIASHEAQEKDYDTIKILFAEELAGVDTRAWQSLAVRVLQQSPVEGAVSSANDQPEVTEENDDDDTKVSDTIEPLNSLTSPSQPAGELSASSNQVAGPILKPIIEKHLAIMGDKLSSQHANDDLESGPVSAQEITDPEGNTTGQEKDKQSKPFHIKTEEDIDETKDMTPPSAKRRKLQEIENETELAQSAESMQMNQQDVQSTLSNIAEDVQSTIAVNATSDKDHAHVTPKQVRDVGSATKKQSAASHGQESVAKGRTGTKRAREAASVDSQTSTASPSDMKSKEKAQALKKLSAASRKFVQRLDGAHATGISLASELRCQHCEHFPDDPRFSSCAHLYCSKCVAQIRKTAVKADEPAKCVACVEDIGKKCSTVTKEQIEEWIKTYGTCNEEDNDEE